VGIITARLQAIEQLAGMDVALCDKTGTLTQNRLKLTDPFLCGGHNETELLMFASLASSAEAPDAIDKVISERIGLAAAQMAKKYEVRDYVPFDPVKKRASAKIWYKKGDYMMEVVKGAPQIVVEWCELQGSAATEVMECVQEFAARGVRGLGVAIRDWHDDVGGEWRMIGVLAMIDPIRPEAPQVIKELAEEGVEVKMVTGDGFDIGRETCRLLGMYTNTVGRQDLLRITASQNDEWAVRKIDQADCFAEVFPEDKFDVVGVLQRNHHIVGMTGDGVNDCPALRRADIGIAVHGSADAARVAADIVFTRQDTTVLSDAVLVSRMIFQRLRSYLLFRINSTFVILFWTFLGEVFFDFGFPALVFVVMAGFNNFIVLALAVDHIVPEHQPLRWKFKDFLPLSFFQGIMSTVEVYVVFSLASKGLLLFSFYLTVEQVRSIVFLQMVVSMQAATFVLRVKKFFFMPGTPRPGFYVILTVLLVCLTCCLVAVYWPFQNGLSPVTWIDVAQVLMISLVFLFLKDLVKVLTIYMVAELMPGESLMQPKLRTISAQNREEFEEIELETIEDDPNQLNHIQIF
jgi:H+-transporting ATPase